MWTERATREALNARLARGAVVTRIEMPLLGHALTITADVPGPRTVRVVVPLVDAPPTPGAIAELAALVQATLDAARQDA